MMHGKQPAQDPTRSIHAVRSYDDRLDFETLDGERTSVHTPVHVPQGGFRRFPFPLRRMLGSTFKGRCPDCGKGSMFAGFIKLKAACEICGVRFERDAGSWLGPTTLAYVVAVAADVMLFAILVWKWGLFPGLEYVLVAGTVVSVAGSYRFLKGWWIWLLWTSELVYADPSDTTPEGPG